jgi:hypothetical protein
MKLLQLRQRRRIAGMKATVLALVALCLPAVAPADIFQWKDAGGVTHYTNIKAEVPEDAQASLQVVVDEAARRPQTPTDAAAQDAPPPAPAVAQASDQPSSAQLVQALYDREQWLNAYLAGLQRGLDTGAGAGDGASVQINGPLAVSGASAVPSYETVQPYVYGYGYGYGWPYFFPGVATVIRRGPTRHAMRPQRVGPFGFQGAGVFNFGGPTPIAINQNPMLLRSLPHGFRNGARVIAQ